MEALQHWWLCLHGKKVHFAHRPSTPCYTSLHNQISPLMLVTTGLKILLIFFKGVVFSTPRDLLSYIPDVISQCPDFLTSCRLQYTAMFYLPWLDFSSSRIMILSWWGTGIMCIRLAVLTTICWQTTLVAFWCTKVNCNIPQSYHKKQSYKNTMICMVVLARYIHKRWSWSNFTRYRWPTTSTNTSETTNYMSVLINLTAVR